MFFTQFIYKHKMICELLFILYKLHFELVLFNMAVASLGGYEHFK